MQTSEKGGTFSSIRTDNSEGAASTSTSLRMDFKFNGTSSSAKIINSYNRDLSLYSGIEFYAKSDQYLVSNFVIHDHNIKPPKGFDIWIYRFEVTPYWKKYKVEFNDLSESKKNISKYPRVKTRGIQNNSNCCCGDFSCFL